MNKKTYSSTKLTCVLQEDYEITPDKCHTGIISITSDGFLFQESIRKGRPPRNPKLYDGKYVSMVRMQNGRYHMHLKTLDDHIDREHYAFDVYCDIMNAFNLSNMEA